MCHTEFQLAGHEYRSPEFGGGVSPQKANGRPALPGMALPHQINNKTGSTTIVFVGFRDHVFIPRREHHIGGVKRRIG